MSTPNRRPALISRALASLCAILAVSAILGAKAIEVEKRVAAREAETAKLASARP